MHNPLASTRTTYLMSYICLCVCVCVIIFNILGHGYYSLSKTPLVLKQLSLFDEVVVLV